MGYVRGDRGILDEFWYWTIHKVLSTKFYKWSFIESSLSPIEMSSMSFEREFHLDWANIQYS